MSPQGHNVRSGVWAKPRLSSNCHRNDPMSTLRRGTLAAVVGIPAALMLLTLLPQQESGRRVRVTIQPDGAATVAHVSGRQYPPAYLDLVGVATACDGITRGVRLGQRYTEAQCAALLERELVAHASGAMACSPGLRGDDRVYPRIAAVMLAYNIGVANWCGSAARRRLDAGQLAAGCDAFLNWDKVRQRGVLVPVEGLRKRRRRERQGCLTGQPGFPPATLAARLEAPAGRAPFWRWRWPGGCASIICAPGGRRGSRNCPARRPRWWSR